MQSPLPLTGKQARFLRALGHDLNPTVQIGRAGITEALLREADAALLAHELIKVRVSADAPTDAKEAGKELAAELGAGLAQVIGHIVVLYRPHPKKPRIQIPRAES